MDGRWTDYIITIITDRLVQHNAAVLPDFGVLFIRNRPAALNLANHQLIAPRRFIDFFHSTQIDDYAVSFTLSEHEEIDLDKAIEVFDDFIGQINEKLNADGSFVLGPLGTFKRSADGDISFIEAEQLPLGITFGMKAAALVPVSRTTEKIKEKAINARPGKATVAPNRSLRINTVRLAAAFLIIVCSVLLFQVISKDRRAQPSFTSVDYDKERLNKAPEDVAQDQSTYTMEELKSSEQKEISATADSVYDEEVMEPDASSDNDISAPLSDADEPNETDNEVAESDSRTVRDANGRYLSVPGAFVYPIESDCAVIVGAFEKESNVSRLTRRIEAMGYTPYTDILKGLIRVGAQSPCGSEELNYNLTLLKRRIEPTAYSISIR